MSQPPGPIACKKKLTCAQCRNRKVRCDGRDNGCKNCSRLGFDCSLLSLQAIGPQSIHYPRPKRARVSRACAACHAMKSRCSGSSPSCERCVTKGLVCIYSRGQRTEFKSTVPRTQPSRPITPLNELMDTTSLDYDPESRSGSASDHQNSSLLNQSLLHPGRIKLAIEVFFKSLHCLPTLAFLHKASLMRFQSDGQADPALVAAIIAVTSLLPEMPATEKEIGSRCVDLAESMIMSSSKRPSISKTQALILVIRYKVWTGSYDDAFMLMAQLTRSAFALRINHETTKPPYFMQESRRRLMWAIYILDSMISCGIQEYTLCPIGSIHIRLPCPEDDFELNNETNVEYIRPYGTSSERVGIIGHYIRIINIHDEVIRYTRRAALPTAEFSALVSDSHNLEHELEIFSSNLPDGERYSQKSLELRSFSPRLPRFIMTHVWWHQAHCQLFRGTLSTSHVFPESYINKLGPEALHESRKKCLHHAHSICAIFASLLALEGDTWTLDYEMAECAYTAAEILLTSDITLQNQLGFTRNQMTEGAAVCLRLMKNLQQMYPYLSTMIADIEQGLLRIPEIVPFGTEISQMIEIAPYQRVPRYSVLGQTCSIHDGNPLGVYTQSPISRASDANFSPLQPGLGSLMTADANYLTEKTHSPSSPYWAMVNNPTFPDLESISNIWGDITFSDPHM